jgi:hypothetical protein
LFETISAWQDEEYRFHPTRHELRQGRRAIEAGNAVHQKAGAPLEKQVAGFPANRIDHHGEVRSQCDGAGEADLIHKAIAWRILKTDFMRKRE